MSRSRSYFRQPSLWIAAALVLLLAAGTAQAQGYAGSREGHWEFTLAPLYQNSGSFDFEGGSKLKTDSEFGFGLGFGYNLSDQFNLGFGFDWYSVSYDATVVKDNSGTTGISGTYDSWLTWANLTMNLAEGPFVPYITAGIGYSFIDTNVPDGRPVDGCYWDPWWGYICGTYYPTKTSSNFSYAAGVGLRYQFSPSFFTKLGYQMTWLDIGKATGTPSFNQFRLDFGWMY